MSRLEATPLRAPGRSNMGLTPAGWRSRPGTRAALVQNTSLRRWDSRPNWGSAGKGYERLLPTIGLTGPPRAARPTRYAVDEVGTRGRSHGPTGLAPVRRPAARFPPRTSGGPFSSHV